MPAAFEHRRICPACESSGARELYTAPYDAPPVSAYLTEYYGPHIDVACLAGAQFALDECVRCGLVFQRWAPGDLLLRTLYEKWIDPDAVFAEHRQLDDLRHHREIADELSMILAFAGKLPADVRVLDFGMGWGNWARMAGAFGCEAFGTEVSERRIAHAARFGVAVAAPEADEHAFDVINTDQVFEHLAQPLHTARMLARALKPGGLLKIAVPNGRAIRWRLRRNDWRAPKGSWRSLNAVAPLEHLNCFTTRSLVEMGRHAGLTPVAVPLPLQYRYNTLHAFSARAIAKSGLRPLLRRFGWMTYQFFRKPEART